MDVVFIRHKMSSTEEILRELWDLGLIALHYQDIDSVDPEDFDPPGRNALRRLWDYCDEGVIACATYRGIHPSTMLLGLIRKGSLVSTRKYDPYIYRVVRLEGIREISYQDYPVLAAIQPQGGTICRWHGAKKHIQAIYSGQPLPREVGSLHPSQLEVLCYEYLRMMGLIDHLVMPLGRNLLDVDICGLGKDGERVLAQVTNTDSEDENFEKINLMTDYRDGSRELIYFGQRQFQGLDAEIRYIPVEEVFAYFAQAPPGTSESRLLAAMLGAGF